MTNRLPLVTATTGTVTRLGTPAMEDLPVRHSIMRKVRRELTIRPILHSAQDHPISTTTVPCMFFSHSRFFFLRLTDEWSRPRCSDSPPVSPITSTSTPTPDYFIHQSSSSSASSPTSPASPVTGYHYNWQPTHTHQSDGSSGHYTPTDLPPQYNPQGSAHNPFQPCVYRIICI